MGSGRVRVVAIVTGVGTVLAILGLAAFTGADGSGDARRFFEVYGEVDADAPMAERAQRIEALAAVPLATDEIATVRDLCVEAHRTLLRAEERGAEARAAFRQATAGGSGEESITDEQRASIETALSESNDALALARRQMPECLRRVHGLEQRYRTRH